MRALMTRIHDIWCAVVRLCRVTPPPSDTADWLAAQERQSYRETHRLRNNPLEQQYLGPRQEGREKP